MDSDTENKQIIHSEEDDNLIQYVTGINYVRPPTLDFKRIKSNKDYTEYEIQTFKNAKEEPFGIPISCS